MNPSLMFWLVVVLLSACAPGGTGGSGGVNGPLLTVEIPQGPTVRVAGARVLSRVPEKLERAFKLFYTSTADRLEMPMVLEHVSAESLEAGFRQAGILVQSRWNYLDTALRTWGFGPTQKVLGVVLEPEGLALLVVQRPDQAPFDGRVLAQRLSRAEAGLAVEQGFDLKIRFASNQVLLGYRLIASSVAGFEYELRRESPDLAGTDDLLNFNVGSSRARFVVQRPRRFPPSSADGLAAQLGSNAVELGRSPAREGSELRFGLDLPAILDGCSLEGLSFSLASYHCPHGKIDLLVTP